MSTTVCRVRKTYDTQSIEHQGESLETEPSTELDDNKSIQHTERDNGGVYRVCEVCQLKGYGARSLCHDVPGKSRGPHTQVSDNER